MPTYARTPTLLKDIGPALSVCGRRRRRRRAREHIQLAHNDVEEHLLVVDAEVLGQLLVDLMAQQIQNALFST